MQGYCVLIAGRGLVIQLLSWTHMGINDLFFECIMISFPTFHNVMVARYFSDIRKLKGCQGYSPKNTHQF